MIELQQELLIAAIGKFFAAIAMSLVAVVNPEDQIDLSPELVLRLPMLSSQKKMTSRRSERSWEQERGDV